MAEKAKRTKQKETKAELLENCHLDKGSSFDDFLAGIDFDPKYPRSRSRVSTSLWQKAICSNTLAKL
jgi:hypothetical protein